MRLYKKDRLGEIEQELNLLANALEANFLLPTYPEVTDSKYLERKHKRKLEIDDYFIQVGRLLVEGYQFAGLRSLRRVRNTISTRRAECEQKSRSYGSLFEVVASHIPRYMLEPYHWSWDASSEGWAAATIRFLASEMRASPVNKVERLRRQKQRRDRYRLHKEERTGGIACRFEPYEYRSWKQALREPECVQRLLLRRHKNPPITAEIARFRNLSFLLLAHPLMKRLPEEIGDLPKLRVLRVDTLGLIELPNTIGNLKQLEMLSASGNQLKALPEEIGGLEKLEVLELAFNDLQTLPESFVRLKNLRLLNLAENDFDRFPCELLAELPNLQTLIWGKYLARAKQPFPDGIQQFKALRKLVLRGRFPLEDITQLQEQCPLLEIERVHTR